MSQELEGLEKLPSLPFMNDYDLGQYYYMRKCYDEYYTLVKRMLDEDEDSITVTGTPGIGKSIFYVFFYKRLEKEMKENNMWIIAVAYKGDELNSAIGYKDNDDNAEEFLSEEEVSDFIRAARKVKKSVILEHGKRIKTDLASSFVVEQLEKRMLELEDGDCE
ncbi:hypothetical protein V7S43_004567 [Phytophthora oleae]|uniref:Uncharacterized protein n=1 Tax=Phytophthora oleae TaxID=2107226 RepID=A0ABD3FX98_9STRA